MALSTLSLLNYWLFIIKSDMVSFKKRIHLKKWPIYYRTSHRRDLEEGDYIIFYKAGLDNGQRFLGTAKITSKLVPSPDKMDFVIGIDDANVWSKCPSIRDYLSKLSFIKNELNWGIYLQAGVKELTKKDYSLITGAAEKMKNQK